MVVEPTKATQVHLQDILRTAIRLQASDVHLVPGHPITYRVHGRFERTQEAALSAIEAQSILEAVLPPRLRVHLGDRKDFDCSVCMENGGGPCRFRANLFQSAGQWCACLRHIPEEIPSFEWMGFPDGLAQRLIAHRNGLVIITGVTGSGKSTTLAALVHLLNAKGDTRVITVEEPVEYVHRPMSTSVVTQREVGRDVDSFFEGLKYGLRQDPDVILVGEIRDRDTAQMALSAAETGHLILTTMHTKDAKGAVTRFVDLFPYDVQDDIRTQIALSLRSVVCQHLLPSKQPGQKRALALEVLHVNQPVRSAIRVGKIDSIESAIQTGKRDGMITLDEELVRLLQTGRISVDIARRFAKDGDAFPG
ncbi:MAG: PilT/PilU family type 4a pilus ATPase [Planctomycetota bacterium]